MSALAHGANRVLSSWKEIASYLGKGVRTVQRWEHQLAMPVHRPAGADKGVVLAYPEELDAWIRKTAAQPHLLQAHAGDDAPDAASEAQQLRERCEALCAAHRKAVAALMSNLKNTMQYVSAVPTDLPRATATPLNGKLNPISQAGA